MTPSTKDTVNCADEVKQPTVPEITSGEGLIHTIKNEPYKKFYKEELLRRIQEEKPEPRPYKIPTISVDLPYSDEDKAILYINGRRHR